MQHLLIVAHPRAVSFTQSVALAYANGLHSLGHSFVVRDLYKLCFDPILSAEELLGPQPLAVPPAIRQEQDHLAEATAVAFFYPLWWAHMLAIMKGYIDRVLSFNFAYEFKGYELIPRLSGKQALIFTSSGADMSYLEESGQWKAMQLLEKDHILALCGIELLEHVHFPSITPDLPEQIVAQHLERVRTTVGRHWGAEPAAQG